MDINGLSNDQVRNVLKEAILNNLVNESDIDKLVTTSPSTDTKVLVDAIHLLMCKENHDTSCDYYQEEQVASEKIFLQVAHRKWMKEMMRLMKLTKIDTVGDMTRVVRRLSNTLSELETHNPGAQILLWEIIAQPSPSDTQP